MNEQLYKADGGKSNPALLEVGCVDALAVVNGTLDYGAVKYEPDSWKDVQPKRYDRAARRHRIARDRGQTFDPESGLAHLAHEIVNNLFVLQMMIEANPGIDWFTFKTPPLDHKAGMVPPKPSTAPYTSSLPPTAKDPAHASAGQMFMAAHDTEPSDA